MPASQAVKEGNKTTRLDEAMEAISAQGRERGFVTSQDLLQGLPVEDLSPQQVEGFLVDVQEYLRREGIEVLEIPGEESGGEGEDPPGNRQGRDDIPANDAVRMYLKDIGKVPLLTAAQEVDLAMRIEAGRVALARRGARPLDDPPVDERRRRRMGRARRRQRVRRARRRARYFVIVGGFRLSRGLFTSASRSCASLIRSNESLTFSLALTRAACESLYACWASFTRWAASTAPCCASTCRRTACEVRS